ncbi:hypothetical protein RJ641_015448 [Dillenia turbinata]|uniref:Uncharacterized protein n=1 Tax=Dillenia turbinata TaxID=194707 RepID=A0AAN8YY77_9MAGN
MLCGCLGFGRGTLMITPLFQHPMLLFLGSFTLFLALG